MSNRETLRQMRRRVLGDETQENTARFFRDHQAGLTPPRRGCSYSTLSLWERLDEAGLLDTQCEAALDKIAALRAWLDTVEREVSR